MHSYVKNTLMEYVKRELFLPGGIYAARFARIEALGMRYECFA